MFYKGDSEGKATFDTRFEMLTHLFGSLKTQALKELTLFLSSEMGLLDEANYAKGFSSINLRYVGVFQNVERAMLAINYMHALCK